MPRKPSEFTTKGVVRSWLRRLWLRSKERSAALKRERYCCQRCGVKQSVAKGREVKLHVHHIDGIDWDGVTEVVIERLLPHPDRLEVLCKACHDEEHRSKK